MLLAQRLLAISDAGDRVEREVRLNIVLHYITKLRGFHFPAPKYRDFEDSFWGIRSASVRGYVEGYDGLEAHRCTCAIAEGICGTPNHHFASLLASARIKRYGSSWPVPTVRRTVISVGLSEFNTL